MEKSFGANTGLKSGLRRVKLNIVICSSDSTLQLSIHHHKSQRVPYIMFVLILQMGTVTFFLKFNAFCYYVVSKPPF